MKTRLVRAASFSAAHRYFNPRLSDEENKQLYGSFYREAGFGHNFQYEAHFEGSIDPLTGMIVNLKDVDRWLRTVTESLDHKRLNDHPAFASDAPTPERIAEFILRELEKLIGQASKAQRASDFRIVKVRLYEGDALWVDAIANEI